MGFYNKMDKQYLSQADLSWLIWGAAFFLILLTWIAFRNRNTLIQMQQKLTTLSFELKKANHNLTNLLGNTDAVNDEADIDETKLYVGNIDYAASEEELASHFSKFGHIEMVNIPLDRYTGRARGFGFVTFKKVTDAIKAMDLDGSEFKGRQIQVNFARERASST